MGWLHASAGAGRGEDEGRRWWQLAPTAVSGAERRLPAGAAPAHLLGNGGAMHGDGANRLARCEATGGRQRCAGERAPCARALSPAPPPHRRPRGFRFGGANLQPGRTVEHPHRR